MRAGVQAPFASAGRRTTSQPASSRMLAARSLFPSEFGTTTLSDISSLLLLRRLTFADPRVDVSCHSELHAKNLAPCKRLYVPTTNRFHQGPDSLLR